MPRTATFHCGESCSCCGGPAGSWLQSFTYVCKELHTCIFAYKGLYIFMFVYMHMYTGVSASTLKLVFRCICAFILTFVELGGFAVQIYSCRNICFTCLFIFAVVLLPMFVIVPIFYTYKYVHYICMYTYVHIYVDTYIHTCIHVTCIC